MTGWRTVSVAPERLAGWVERFTERHGDGRSNGGAEEVGIIGADGAEAMIAVPFPPLDPETDPVAALVAHALRARRVGVILARKGGYATGIFLGDRLVSSKVGSSYVQGKTKAGGWSQQRYARRRDNQARQAYAGAADEVARLLVPAAATLDAVVTGGDQTAVAAVLADPRLASLGRLVFGRVHPTADPRLRVLQAFPEQFRAVEIRLNALA